MGTNQEWAISGKLATYLHYSSNSQKVNIYIPPTNKYSYLIDSLKITCKIIGSSYHPSYQENAFFRLKAIYYSQCIPLKDTQYVADKVMVIVCTAA